MRKSPLLSCVLALGICPFTQTSLAQTSIFQLSEDFSTDPAGFTIATVDSTNATAELSVSGEGKLVFDGVWNVPASGSEDAYGFLDPAITFDPSSYQIDPIRLDPIAAVTFVIDASLVSDSIPSEDGLFVALRVVQRQPDGSTQLFGYARTIRPGMDTRLDEVLSAEDFSSFGPALPDFSPYAAPLSFGLQLGATVREVTGNAGLTWDGQLSVDNWQLEVIGMPLFADDFELEN